MAAGPELVASEWAGRRHQPGEVFDVGATSGQYVLSPVPGSIKKGYLTYLLRPDDWLRPRDQLADVAVQRFATLDAEFFPTVDVWVAEKAKAHLEPGAPRDGVLRLFADEGLRLFRFLAHQLGRRHEAMVINLGGLGHGDTSKGVAEIWNHAVFHCTTDFIERDDPARPKAATDEDDISRNVLQDRPLGMDLEIAIVFNRDVPPPEAAPEPAVLKPYGLELVGGAHDTLRFALRIEYDGHGVPRSPDPEHFVDAWASRAPGRWIPRSLMTLVRPVSTRDAAQTAKEEHERDDNLEVARRPHAPPSAARQVPVTPHRKLLAVPLLAAGAWGAASGGCDDAPPRPPPPRMARAIVASEHLRAVIPPDWPVGMTWAVEGKAPYNSRNALEEQGAMNAWWAGQIEFRVVENDGEQARVDAVIRPGPSNHAPCWWSMRYSLEPFAIVTARTVGLTRDVESEVYVADTEPDWGWLTPILVAPIAPDAPLYRQWWTKAAGVPVVHFGDQGIWLETFQSAYGANVALRRWPSWRAGDPWFAISEALDQDGRPAQVRSPPARFRLIEIDGEPIEPVPWSEGHRR